MINPKAALVSAGFILLMLAAGFVALGTVPADARITTHLGWDGRPDGWMSPAPAFFFAPVISAALWLLALAVPRLGESGARLSRHSAPYALFWLLPVLIAVPADLVVIGPSLGLSWAGIRLMPVAIGLLFVLLGNVMGKLPPNPFIGIRNVWTRNDERVWDQTHRFGGWVFVIGGFIILGSAMLTPRTQAFPPVVLVVVIFAAALCTAKSWLLARDQRRR